MSDNMRAQLEHSLSLFSCFTNIRRGQKDHNRIIKTSCTKSQLCSFCSHLTTMFCNCCLQSIHEGNLIPSWNFFHVRVDFTWIDMWAQNNANIHFIPYVWYFLNASDFMDLVDSWRQNSFQVQIFLFCSTSFQQQYDNGNLHLVPRAYSMM
jgi:hypothetical protein